MALTGWGSTNFLRYGGAVLTTAPLTMACWIYHPSTFSALESIVGVYQAAAAAIREQFVLNISATGTVLARTCDSVGGNSAQSTASTSAGVWFHACGVFASSSDRRAFLNGGNKGTNTTSRTPAGLDRTSLGKQDNAGNNNFVAPDVSIAEAAIWNIAMSDAEVAQLAVFGTRATAVRPDALVAYWPLPGISTMEFDVIGGNNLAVQGGLSAASHPWNVGTRMGAIGCGL